MSKSRILPDAAAVWHQLAVGPIEPHRRDEDLVASVVTTFRMKAGAPVDAELLRLGVTVEALVSCLFTAAAPYVEMWGDLLRLFERAAASRGGDHLDIRFDFDRAPEVRFDLSLFRSWMRVARLAPVTRDKPIWTHGTLRLLGMAIEQAADGLPPGGRGPVQEWQEEYTAGRWPEAVPQPPTQLPPDSVVPELFALVSMVAGASRRVGPDRRALSDVPSPYAAVARGGRVAAAPPPTLEEDSWLLRLLDEQDWCGRVLADADRIGAHESEVRGAPYEDLRAALKRPTRPATVMELTEQLEAFLSLPLWQRRHDLYSAWVGAVLVEGLGPSARVLTSNGQLVWSFAGTHLASRATAHGGEVRLWAELRSPLSAPRGKGRVGAVQPDYTLLRDPTTSPHDVLLVVECKHYLRASVRGFSDALDDYARARPCAEVVLVNYGPGNTRIVGRVGASQRGRVQVVAPLRPDRPAERATLEAVLRKVLPAPAPVAAAGSAVPPSLAAGLGRLNSVSLRWDTPDDLDLHVELGALMDATVDHVSFGQRGSLDVAPFALLDGDVTTGPGTECVRFAAGAPARALSVSVHHYSGSSSFAAARALVTLTFEAGEVSVRAPGGPGRLWRVGARCDEGGWEFVNLLAPDFPVEGA